MQKKGKLIEELRKKTTREQFEQLIETLVAEEDRILFGNSPKEFFIHSILYPVHFAPPPTRFSSELYVTVLDDVVEKLALDLDRTQDALRIERLALMNLENELVEMFGDDRMQIPKDVHAVLSLILPEYEEFS